MSLAKTALTEKQLDNIRTSYENGLRSISRIPELDEAAEIIRYQHEKFDGSGLFNGLTGSSIPLLSRILAVASAFERTNYHRNLSVSNNGDASAINLRQRAGTEFDPVVVEACLGHTLVPQAENVGAAPQSVAGASMLYAEALA